MSIPKVMAGEFILSGEPIPDEAIDRIITAAGICLPEDTAASLREAIVQCCEDTAIYRGAPRAGAVAPLLQRVEDGALALALALTEIDGADAAANAARQLLCTYRSPITSPQLDHLAEWLGRIARHAAAERERLGKDKGGEAPDLPLDDLIRRVAEIYAGAGGATTVIYDAGYYGPFFDFVMAAARIAGRTPTDGALAKRIQRAL
jgi:hypothetical protein